LSLELDGTDGAVDTLSDPHIRVAGQNEFGDLPHGIVQELESLPALPREELHQPSIGHCPEQPRCRQAQRGSFILAELERPGRSDLKSYHTDNPFGNDFPGSVMCPRR
jgi:hypothetical protein